MESEQLLLAYTYFINNENSKYISVGYSVENFSPCVIINYIGLGNLKLGLPEWLNIFMVKHEEISSLLNAGGVKKCQKLIKTMKNTLIKFDEHTKTIVISNIAINHDEWLLKLQLTDYIQSVLYWCRQTTKEVSSYYNEYVKRCIELNTISLDTTDFFTNTNSIFKWNDSRLFFEIPILCKNKLYNDINNYNYCKEFLKLQ